MTPTHFPARFTPRHPWSPMTDAEWHALSRWLTPRCDTARTGRPPDDPRATWDAIFWIACSSAPWRDLPPELGKPDTAHRTLRRVAARGRLSLLLYVLARRAERHLQTLEWRIARAFRRMFRVLPGTAIGLAQRLGLLSALPTHPAFMPRPDDWGALLLRAARIFVTLSPAEQRASDTLMRILHRRAIGEPKRWKTTD